jgi:iturin family lipopeptide synthetase A
VRSDDEVLASVCSILADVLGRSGLSGDANFRASGGDSLRAVKAVGRIAVEFDTSDDINELLLEALLDGADAITVAELVGDPAAAGRPPVAEIDGAEAPLSYGEERIWLAQRYHPDSAAYHVVNAFRITGEFDSGALADAVAALVARHPALSARYRAEAPRLAPAAPAPVDVRHQPGPVPLSEALAVARQHALVPFDLAEGRLLRVRTYALTAGETLLLVVAQHIATDGWSMGLFYRELSDLYAGRQPAPEPAAYRDFARWQRGSTTPIADADAILDSIGALPDRVELDRLHRRPPTRSMTGEVYRTRLGADVAPRLTELATRTGVTLHVVLLALYHLCLARRTGQWDVVLGTVVAGRTQPRYHDTVGFFANTMPIRVRADLAMPITALLGEVDARTRWTLTHQDAPMEELAVRARQLPDPAHTPLVDAVLILQNNDVALPRFAGCAVTPVPMHTGTAKFDLLLEVTPDGTTGELSLNWEYATDVLDGAEVARLAASYEQLARAITEPDATVRTVIRMSEAERAQLTASSGPSRAWPRADPTVLFDALAAADPGAPAVLDGESTVDRERLRALREAFAGGLAAARVRAGDVVVVALPRSAASVAAMLAVWRLGAVLMLLDHRHPVAHRDDLLLRSGAVAVVSDDPAGWPPALPVVVAGDAPVYQGPPVFREPGDPAWLVATSGSTGAPKITIGTHRGLRNRCGWAWETLPYAADDVAAVRTPPGFVDAVAEIAVPLLAGVPLAIVPDRQIWDARELVSVLREHRVTRLLATPSMLRGVLDVVPDLATRARWLRTVVCSGEPFDLDLLTALRTALPGRRLINLYGSSEVAADVTWAEVTERPVTGRVPIGRPITNTTVLVVDEAGEPVPPGTVGELFVTGDPVGSGYLVDGQPVRTGGFRPGACGDPGYATGDLGWLGPDGALYFAGRRDRQVKIHGCRVELGQIEAAGREIPGVRQLAAWADGGHRVLAAVLATPGHRVSGAEVRIALRARLPHYMVPARVVVLDALPLNANGKLDTAAVAALGGADDPAPDVPGLPPAQRYLRLLWSKTLDGEPAATDDDFFSLGGDSLAANTMLAALARDTGVVLEIGDFLAEPTIRALAGRLTGVAVPEGPWS